MSLSHSDECEALSKAFSGFGVDERSLISILGKWKQGERASFRKATPHLFVEDDRSFERWNHAHVALLEREFLRLKNAVVLWTMHPWERDARLANEAIIKQSYGLLVEVACTRSSDELLGARRAYHSLFDRSIEEDVAFLINGPQQKLLVALVSSYRYEGPKVDEEAAKSDAKTLCNAIKNAGKINPIENEEVVRILSTRSKLHLKALLKHCAESCGQNIDEELNVDLSLKEIVYCLCTPQLYFTKVLNAGLNHGADENSKDAVTRVIVTRADVDIKEINEAYNEQCGVSLSSKIDEIAHGNYKDFLLALVARGE